MPCERVRVMGDVAGCLMCTGLRMSWVKDKWVCRVGWIAMKEMDEWKKGGVVGGEISE